MDYIEVLEYLYKNLPMYQREGNSAIKKNLTNTILLCEALENPHKKWRPIHIAGTNGKGSTAHSIASILQKAHYKTGLYTSPHLKSFTERIKINGKEIPTSYITTFVNTHKSLLDNIKPSFFEMTVAMAFSYFAQEKVDFAVIETGLGGRLDSTNIINPEVSLITSIGYDHTEVLGDTLELIAGEKAGIIKDNTPVIIGVEQPFLRDIFQKKAQEHNADIIFTTDAYKVMRKTYSHKNQTSDVFIDNEMLFQNLETDINGLFYLKNIPGILETIYQLRKKNTSIPDTAIVNGLKEVKNTTGLKGRWQIIQESPLMIADIGHNESGIEEVLKQISLETFENLFIIFGMVKEKKRDAIWSILPKNAYYFFTQANIPRALDKNILLSEAIQNGLQGELASDVNAAISEAKKRAKKTDMIFIGGSTFMVAEVDNL
ncbi:MAG: Mur ligase family protein [Chitinophagaceae bacterium]|nr:Mur ligase family protein [Chitinophagaceae bacterium]